MALLAQVSTQRLFVSSINGANPSGGASIEQVFSTINNSTLTNVFVENLYNINQWIPFSTLGEESAFNFKASTTQLYFGGYSSTGQIYVADIYNAVNDTTRSTPTIFFDAKYSTGTATQTFTATGADQTFVVPPTATSITVELRGAGGGTGSSGSGGAGGLVSGTLAVTPGETLTLVVGKGGTAAYPNFSNRTYGGGGKSYNYGGSGGGRSAIRRSGADIVTAGGGGGAGSAPPGSRYGGAGGGLTGANGYDNNEGGVFGYGGTQSAGGAGGYGDAQAGSLGQGGDSSTGAYFGGGGGGGGYYGGGGGAYFGGAGGGSSYVANLTGTVVNTQGGGSAAQTDGLIIITYPAKSTRPGNLLEMVNFTDRKLIIDPYLRVGINQTTINPSYQLDVSGATRSLTMDVSSIGGTSLTVNTPTSLVQDTISRSRIFLSTMGTGDLNIVQSHLGLKLIILTPFASTRVNLPNPATVGAGFNFVVCNSRSSVGNLDFYDYNGAFYGGGFGPGSPWAFTSDGTNFYNF